MKKVLKSSLAIILAVTIILSSAIVGLNELDFDGLFTVEATAADSGVCGKNLTWTVDDSGTLTISGTGDMDNFNLGGGDFLTPWYHLRENINTISINDGVTNISEYAFYGLKNITSIIIPDSVTSIENEAFNSCTNLKTIIIPDSVTTIEFWAFNGTAYYDDKSNWEDGVLYIGNHLIEAQYSLSGEYKIKEGTKTIADEAFYSCTKLTSIEIPDSVTHIGRSAFVYCANLDSVILGNSLTSIDSYAFWNCTSLTSITIPDSVTNIGNCAFSYCASINVDDANSSYSSIDGILFDKNKTTLVQYPKNKKGSSYIIPDSVTSIGAYAFYACGSLTTITLPDGVTSIGSYAFEECNGLASITLPDSVTSIGHRAFCGCAALASITIGNSLTSIDSYAFWNCTSLTSITIPDGVTSIHYSAFEGCTSLASIVLPDNLRDIDSAVFAGCISLASIVIPDSVTFIGDRAFYNCTSLTSITIPDSVTSIHYSAFEGCTSLASIVIPDSVTFIGDRAFYNCTSLTSITIPDSVEDIDSSSFNFTGYYNNSDNWVNGALYIGNHLITVSDEVSGEFEIKPGTKTIVGLAFADCTSLTSIVIPDSVTSIGESAFSGCTNLQKLFWNVKALHSYWSNILEKVGKNSGGFEVVFGDSVEEIPKNVFAGAENLVAVVFSDGVTNICDYALSGCKSLESITIPESVTSIGYSAFKDCLNLEKVYWNAKCIEDDAYGLCVFETADKNSGGFEVIFGDSVEKIPANAFSGAKNLVSVEIPDSVTSIGSSAFSSCESLTSIKIGSNVTSIGDYTFIYCTNLVSVIIPDSVTSIGAYAFSGCTNLQKVYWDAKCAEDGEYDASVFKNAGENSGGFEVVFGDSVEEIPGNVFANSENLISVVISDSVTSISADAFNKCAGLMSIRVAENNLCYFSSDGILFNKDKTELIKYPEGKTDTGYEIPDSIARIGDYALADCARLTTIKIPDSVTNIGFAAFRNCTGLVSVTIPDSVNTIERCAFSGCTGLTSVTIPDSVRVINDSTFQSCTSMKTITIPDGVTSIGDSAFDGCTSLASITIPDSVTSIGCAAFCGCTSLNSIRIPDRVTSISHSAFQGCTRLKSITIPDGITSIGDSAFDGCTSLTFIRIPDRVTSIGNFAFSGCTGLTSVKIPDGVKSIRYAAFNNCTSLASITIPDGATFIDYSAFYGCTSLTSIAIPVSVTRIGDRAIGYYYDYENFHNEKIAGFTIYGVIGSVAETYANNNGFAFVNNCSHKSTSWVIDKEATVYSAGKKHRECKVCGETVKTATIKQLKCSKPTLKTIANTAAGVKITWGKVTGADKYEVYRKVKGGSYSKLGTTSKTYFTDKTAKSGKQYYYVVKAVNEAGRSSASSYKTIKYLADPALKTPTSTKSGITLKWNKVTGANGYIIYRKTGNGSYSKLATVKGVSKVSYVDKSAKKGKKYTYKVKAYYVNTYSAYSNAKTIKDKY